MTYTIYLSGEIHSDWRDQIKQEIVNRQLDIEILTPVTHHDQSDNVGIEILGNEENSFWKDHKGAKINSLRTNHHISRADLVVIRFGDKYKQWNAAFDAGLAVGKGIPIITLHSSELIHPLKEIDAAAIAVVKTPKQVIDIISYILQD
ncbi:MAG: YtoQ family protein [Methylococcales bacterium]|nr:YtoQ family protein [Methylococcales bacterium]